jgi:single-strand DNA-binding protein
MNLNKAFVLGNVTRDPEVKMLPSGQQVASFGIATNRFYTQNGEKKTEAEFHNITCFGKLADIAARYLKKGSLVFVEGRIKTNSWNNKEGVKQYRTEIVADTMQLGPRGSGTGGMSGGDMGGSSQSSSYQKSSQQDSPSHDDIPVIEENYPAPGGGSLDSGSEEIDVKDIPF